MKYDNVVASIVDKMFEISGHPYRYRDLQAGNALLLQCTMTPEQKTRWMEWGKKYLRSKGYCSPDHRMQVLNLSWGLRETTPQVVKRK